METLKQYKRLLHTLVPFAGFMFCRKVTELLVGFVCADYAVTETVSFVVSAAAAYLLFRMKVFESDDNPQGVSPIEPDSVGIGVLYAFFAFGAGISLRYLAEMLTDFKPQTYEMTVFSVLSTVVVHPLIYEYLFRRLFYSDLRLMSTIFGCLATAVMTAITHGEVVSMAFWLFNGVVLGYVTEQSGRLFPALAAHMICNIRLLCVCSDSLSEKLCETADAVFISAGMLALILILILRSRTFAQEGIAHDGNGAEDRHG